MGYYTRYRGSVSGPPEFLNDFNADAQNGESFGEYDLPLSHFDSDILGGESMTWYDWRDDMIALSNKYPALLFEIEGEGEESGDVWKAYIRNGRCVEVEGKIVFEEPNFEEELPLPDETEMMLSQRKNARRRELDQKIAELTAEREALGD